MLHSAKRVQLGYPFGTLLFCLAIQPIIRILHSDFRVFYLDDATIGGRVICPIAVRPIVVGQTLHRLVAKCGNSGDALCGS